MNRRKWNNLKINKKTRIYRNTNRFIFLGRDFDCKYARYRSLKRKIKRRKNMYLNNRTTLTSLACTLISYDSLTKKVN